MKRRAFSGAIVVFLFALPVCAVEEIAVDAGGCPVSEVWAVPAEALVVDAPGAIDVPLIPDADMLACDVVVDCGLRFQEVLPLPEENGVVVLDGLRFRIDESTPLSSVDAVNCWTVEVALGVYPNAMDEVSEIFDLNTVNPPTVVYEGPICLDHATDSAVPGLGEELVVPFAAPYVFDCTDGSLVVDVTVNGIAGFSENVLLDAVVGPEVVTVVSLEGPGASAGDVFDGGPVIILDGYEGPSQPGDPRDCLMALDIPERLRTRLLDLLSTAEEAADSGRLRSAHFFMGYYHRIVDRYERRDVITTDAAEKAHEYGSRAAGGFFGPFMIADAIDEVAGIRPVLTVFGLEGLVAEQIPDGSRAYDRLDQMDGLLGEIFFDGVIDAGDRGEIYDWRRAFRGFISEVWRDVTRETRSLLWEAWRFASDFLRRYQNDPEFRFLVDLWLVAGDGVIDQDEVGALKDLRQQLIELMNGLDPRNPMARAFKGLPYIFHQLIAKLEKGEIGAISVSPLDGGGLGIGIDTEDPVWIQIFKYGVPDDADYLAGDTITILVRVSDAWIEWTPTEDGHVIEVSGLTEGGGLSVNINVTDWWTVLAWEWSLGIDLDDLRIHKVTLSGDKVIIEAISDEGEPVRIEVENGEIKVEVNDQQVYPEP